MIDIRPLRDQAWEFAVRQETKGWHEYLAAFEKKYAELLFDHWNKLHDTRVPTNPYHYETFEDYWKVIVRYLWNTKEWDNEKIKECVKDAFEDARRKK